MKIKEILATIGGICVVVLQIINVLQTVDIENLMGKKANLMEQKAADIRTLVTDRTALIEKEIQGVLKTGASPSPSPSQ
jgi:hypothetical protein